MLLYCPLLTEIRINEYKVLRDIVEGLDVGVWNSLISKNLAHYSLSLKFLLIL